MFEFWVIVTLMSAVLFSIVIATIALLRCYFPPQSRAVMELRAELGEIGEDNDRINARLNERAARENMAIARARKTSKADALNEAEVILRERLTAAPAEPAVTDPDALRAQLRRKHLQ